MSSWTFLITVVRCCNGLLEKVLEKLVLQSKSFFTFVCSGCCIQDVQCLLSFYSGFCVTLKSKVFLQSLKFKVVIFLSEGQREGIFCYNRKPFFTWCPQFIWQPPSVILLPLKSVETVCSLKNLFDRPNVVIFKDIFQLNSGKSEISLVTNLLKGSSSTRDERKNLFLFLMSSSN